MPQPLTQEQFQRLKQQGFTTEKIIEFEKRRLAETPIEEAITPEIVEKPKKTLWKALGAEITPEMEAQHPIFSSIAKTGQDLTTIGAHFVNQLLMNYPRSALAKAGVKYPETENLPANIAAKTAGIVGGLKNPLVKALMGAKALPLGQQVVRGAVTGGVYAPTEDIVGVKERLKNALLGGAVPFVGRGINKVINNPPQIMGERWFEKEAKLAQKVASGLEKTRGIAYKNIYSKINKAPISPLKINNILKKYDLINELGSPSSMNIEQAKVFSDELSQYIPQAIKKGQVYGKGGWANPKIRAEKAAEEIKNLIYQSAEQAERSGTIEEGATQSLKNLDKLAREQLYPRAEKIRSIGGYSPEPETSGISSAYRILRGSEGAAGKRLAIKRAPQSLKELSQYIAPKEKDKLAEAIEGAQQLSKNMRKYRSRQLIKTLATGGAGAIALWDYLFRRKIAGEVLH